MSQGSAIGEVTTTVVGPSVLARLLTGSAWLALRTPLSIAFGLLSIPLIVRSIGENLNGAYQFAWGFGFFQMLLEFGMGSALSRRVAEAWTRGDRDAVDRAVSCGLWFYAAMALVQMGALAAVIVFAVPYSGFDGEARRLVEQLLWLQVVTAPCYGLAMVVSSVLQAARRYDVIPRWETAVMILRFIILVVGLELGFPFFWIIVATIAVQIGLTFGPAIWTATRQVGYVPRWSAARGPELMGLLRVSLWVFLLNLAAILADKLDRMVLGFALSDPGPAVTIYTVVSKPFQVISQAAWTLGALIVPAAASLHAANDREALRRLVDDGPRLLVAPAALAATLAAAYAGPFLSVWMGPEWASRADLLRLMLVAALPLVMVGWIQVGVGLGHIRAVAAAGLAGAAVNLGLSYALTVAWQDVSGVIWGTVLTALVSNLIVPALYLRTRLGGSLRRLMLRGLRAPAVGAAAACGVAWLLQSIFAADRPSAGWGTRASVLGIHLTIATLAFAAGYAATPEGRADFRMVANRLLGRFGR